MSGQRALLQALVGLMRARRSQGFGLDSTECEISHDGSPPPMAGQWFWAVSHETMQADASVDFTTKPTLLVTVSARVGDLPYDRLGPEFTAAEGGMLDRLEYFMAWLSTQQYTLMNNANALLQEGHDVPVNGFIHPAFKMVMQPFKAVGAAHWQSVATMEKLKSPLSPAGIVGTVRLSDFQRTQYLESAADE